MGCKYFGGIIENCLCLTYYYTCCGQCITVPELDNYIASEYHA